MRLLPAPVGGVLCAGVFFAVTTSSARPQCEQAKLLAGDGMSNDNFSKAVAIEGAVAVIGAPNDDHAGLSAGSVHVFRRTGRVWNFEAKLTADVNDANDQDLFGAEIDLSGEVIAVGAYGDDEASTNAGAAYVFRRVGGVWTPETKLFASDALSNSYFGRSIALEGNVLIVGAYLADTNLFDEGAAYVFRFDGASWVEEAKLSASDGDLLDYFGFVVALSGDVALVSAYLQDDRGVDAGIVYVFRNSGTTWTEETKLFAADTAASDFFGQALDIEGARIIVGAPGNNDAGPYTGSAYLFEFDGSQWVELKKLLPSDGGGTQDIFGVAVAIDGDVVVVGEPGDDSTLGNAGSAHIFRFDGVDWVFEESLVASDVATGQLFGNNVDMDGAFMLCGAYGDSELGSAAGAAYVDLYDDAVASWNNYGAGYPGTGGIPGISLDADPVIGTTVNAMIDNSFGSVTFAILMVGIQSTSVPTSLGGTLLVIPSFLLPIQMPSSGSSLPLEIRCNDVLIGAPIFMQSIIADPGASRGASFTPGLCMKLGF